MVEYMWGIRQGRWREKLVHRVHGYWNLKALALFPLASDLTTSAVESPVQKAWT